jgi:3-oxoacyl-[acyl-carrier protein] reductase
MRLKDKVAIVTAGAGAGIGRTAAGMMAGEGARVVVADMHEQRAVQTARTIQDKYVVETIGIKCDVTSPDDVKGVVETTLNRFGRIDILLNNAGTNRPMKIVDMKDETWDLVVNTSLKGTFYCTRAVLPAMMEQEHGRIVNIASVAGFRGLDGGHSHYAAVKAGVMAFTRCLAMEAARYRITANTIAPSFIYNEFIPNIYPGRDRKNAFRNTLSQKRHAGGYRQHGLIPGLG